MLSMQCLPSLTAGVLLWCGLVLSAVGQEQRSIEVIKSGIAIADRELNQVYQKAKSILPEWVFAELQEDQRSWIGYRDGSAEETARFDGGAEEGKEKLSSWYWETILSQTKGRISTIEGWMNWDKFAHEWEGVWADGHGGLLSILQNEPGEFTFRIDVVRGPTYHLGGLDGVARWNGSTARFSVKDEIEEKETWLTFIKRGVKLEVIGENTSPFHGARAYFDGKYVRIRELTDEDRREILSPESL
jgi:uncharacterized protein YecT (DUF1311 family)